MSGLRPLYILPTDPLAEEVLIPGFQASANVDCMVGFFTSDVLASLAPGLATYINATDNTFRLIISPILRVEDQTAIVNGLRSAEEVAGEILDEIFITEELIQQHTLRCLSWMLRKHRLEIRVALMKEALFHPKVWLFCDEVDIFAVHGSSNVTHAGIHKNIEQITISRSWKSPNQRDITKKLRTQFDRLWSNTEDICIVIPMPEAIKRRLLKTYRSNLPPTENDLQNLYCRAARFPKGIGTHEVTRVNTPKLPFPAQAELTIPSHLDLCHGPFAHQGKALEAWENANRRGFLEMATGSGKTITALAAATRLQKDANALLVIISAPYKPLVSQWVEEVESFGIDPLPIGGSAAQRAHRLELAIRGLHVGVSTVEVMIVTENFLTSEDFRRVFDAIPETVTSLLIADEAHHLGRHGFIVNPPDRFTYRLGLSATPKRQYDPDGTVELFRFFGRPVFEFSLQEAIGVCLVPYNYYIHQVGLNDDEYCEWKRLTERLVRKGFEGDADTSDSGQLSDDIRRLLIARRRVIESAENKVVALRSLLQKRRRDDIRHVLVYATDKNRRQLQAVNNMLQHDLNLTIHELTSRQTANRRRSADLLDRFAAGDYNVLTCMRVLDEGVDVPQVSEAFILASNTVKRQWIQRRGRVLRKCEAIDKRIAHLHDFIVVPPNPRDSRSRAILRGELRRANEFAALAANAGTPGGPFDEIEKLMRAMFG